MPLTSLPLLRKGEHQEGDTWTGPSGREFTLEHGHVHPVAGDAQTSPASSGTVTQTPAIEEAPQRQENSKPSPVAGRAHLPDDTVRTNWTTDPATLPESFSVENLPAPAKSALKSYTRKGDEEMNGFLRGTSHASPAVQKKIAAIRKAFATAPEADSPQSVWRGVNLGQTDRAAFMETAHKSLATGEPLVGKCFTSTSTQFEVATAQFSSVNTPLLMEITTRKGLYLEPLSKFEQEHEVLIDHEARFRVVGIKKLKYLKRGKSVPMEIETIQLEQI